MVDLFHLLDGSMTVLAGHSRGHVALMREIDIIWNFVNANPLDWGAFLEMLLDLLDPWTVRLHDTVTVHTDSYRRNGSVLRLLRAGVAVKARDLEIARMKLVTVGNWLLWSVVLI